jgi:hypothetical protein
MVKGFVDSLRNIFVIQINFMYKEQCGFGFDMVLFF